MAYSGFTWLRVEPQNGPNEGRDKINTNFENVATMFGEISVASSTGATIVTSGTNIQVNFLGYSGGTVPIYGVSTTSDVNFDNLSASTYYSAGTPLEVVIEDIASQFSAGTSYWDASGGNIFNNNGGLVGINTTTPTRNLEVSGTSVVNYADYIMEVSDNTPSLFGNSSGASFYAIHGNTLTSNGVVELFGQDISVMTKVDASTGIFDGVIVGLQVGTIIIHSEDIAGNASNSLSVGDDGIKIYGRTEGTTQTNTVWSDSGNTTLMQLQDQGLITDNSPDVFVVMDPNKNLRSLPFSAITAGAQSYINLDYASALSLATSSGLTPGALYAITDAAHANGATGQIFTRAVNVDTLDVNCTWRRPTDLKAFGVVEFLEITSDVTDVVVGINNELSSTVLFNTDTYNTVVDIVSNINANIGANVTAKAFYPASSTTSTSVYLILEWKTATSAINGDSITISSVSPSIYNTTPLGEGSDPVEYEYAVDYDLYSNNIKRLVDAKNNFEIFDKDAINYNFRLEDASYNGQFPFIGTNIIDSDVSAGLYLRNTCFSGNTIEDNSIFNGGLLVDCTIVNNVFNSADLFNANQPSVFSQTLIFNNTFSASFSSGWLFSGGSINTCDLKQFGVYRSYLYDCELVSLSVEYGVFLESELYSADITYSFINQINFDNVVSSQALDFKLINNTINSLYLIGDIVGLNVDYSSLHSTNIGSSNSSLINTTITNSSIFDSYIGGNSFSADSITILNSDIHKLELSDSDAITGLTIEHSNIQDVNIATGNLGGYLYDTYLGNSTITNLSIDSAFFSGLNISDSTMSDNIVPSISGQNLLFSGAQITNSSLSSVVFDNFHTNQLVLESVDFAGGVFSGSSISNSRILGGPSSNYNSWTINSSNISNSTIENCDTTQSLWESNFAEAYFLKSNFRASYFSSVDFSGSRLFGSNFEDSTLSNLSLAASQIDNSSFSGANISNSSMSGNNISQLDLTSVSFQGVSWNNSVAKKFAEMSTSSFSGITLSSNIADRDFNFYVTKTLDGSINNGYAGDPVSLMRVPTNLITYFSQTDYVLTNLGVSSTDVSVGYSLYFTTGLTSNLVLSPGANSNFIIDSPNIKASGTTYNEVILTPISETISGTITLGLKGMIGL